MRIDNWKFDEHQGWVDAHTGGYLRISGGVCYGESENEMGYNMVQLDLDSGAGNIWLRKYNPDGIGGWIPNVIPGKTGDNGVWLLENLLKKPAADVNKKKVVAMWKMPSICLIIINSGTRRWGSFCWRWPGITRKRGLFWKAVSH
ncbi:MAG: hypothetical protein GY757_46390 [bacterium]|nr:hypothetical protein [bacterium]